MLFENYRGTTSRWKRFVRNIRIENINFWVSPYTKLKLENKLILITTRLNKHHYNWISNYCELNCLMTVLCVIQYNLKILTIKPVLEFYLLQLENYIKSN